MRHLKLRASGGGGGGRGSGNFERRSGRVQKCKPPPLYGPTVNGEKKQNLPSKPVCSFAFPPSLPQNVVVLLSPDGLDIGREEDGFFQSHCVSGFLKGGGC